jgi:hypothetical protein
MIKLFKIHKNYIQQFIKLSNGQWMKILFNHWIRREEPSSCWTMSIVVANSKRQCNDCLNKTEYSPKVIYGQQTGHKLGLEPFLIALKSLHEFEKLVDNCEIHITPANKKLKKTYSYLQRYGYKTINEKNKKIIYSKYINKGEL